MATITLTPTASNFVVRTNPDYSYIEFKPLKYNGNNLDETGLGRYTPFYRFDSPVNLKYKKIKQATITASFYFGESYTFSSISPVCPWAPYVIQADDYLASLTYNNCSVNGILGAVISPTCATSMYEGVYSVTIDVTSGVANNLSDGTRYAMTLNSTYCLEASNPYVFADPVLTIVYEDVPPANPTATYPNGVYLHEGEDVIFTWQFNSSTGAVQSSAQLEYRAVGASTWTTVSLDQSSYSYILRGGLPQGEYEWRVKTTNDAAEVSGYSSIAKFSVIGKPAVPYINEPKQATLTEFTWQSADQVSFDIELKDSADRIILAESIGSGEAVYRPNMFLANGTYTLGIAYSNSSGLWSDMAYKVFNLEAEAPEPPTAAIIVNDTSIDITYESTTPVAIMRSENGGEYEVVAKPENGAYRDDTIKPGVVYVYKVRAYEVGYADSEELTARVDWYGAIITSGNLVAHLRLSVDAWAPYTETINTISSTTNYTGREFALVEHSEFTQQVVERQFYCDFDTKPVLAKLGKLDQVFYRDDMGNAFTGSLTGIRLMGYNGDGYTVALTIVRTNSEEVELNV